MTFLDFYYLIKPRIPRRLQIAFRRLIVRRQRVKYQDLWPIDEKAGKPPEGWPGWPEGKKFAFILTHDVEGSKGVDRCHLLADIDKGFGFRSSFNFVPEECKNSVFFHPYLIEIGFEVGIHGLHHNGNLFASRKKFVKMASKIDNYLKKWQSVGFRTPSMYHNLDWIGELRIEYDGSTFDTDPFEPQPDGMGTIFPFWVPANVPSSSFLDPRSSTLDPRSYELTPTSHELLQPNKPNNLNGLKDKIDQTNQTYQKDQKGFVELPYTLPQDFTLFIIMQEKTIDLWKKKLHWIVEKGGMALLITHPDYMNFNQTRPILEEYPVSLYEEFLNYIKQNYRGQYWNPLPKEMASFWKKEVVSSSLKPQVPFEQI